MFCPKCGTEVTEGVFCPSCGCRISEIENIDMESANDGNALALEKLEKKKNPKKNNLGMILGIIAAVVIVILGVAAIMMNSKPTIKLDKYLIVEFEGYDTIGKANVSIDWDGIEKKYGKKIKINRKLLNEMLKEEYGEFGFLYTTVAEQISTESSLEMLKECIGGGFDKYTGLSNGDEIVYTWDIEQETVDKLFNCKLEYNEKSYVVEGLEKVETFDPFEYLTLQYSGVGPNGNVTLENDTSSEMMKRIQFKIDKNSGLNNGDKVIVTASMSIAESDFVGMFGKLPSPLEKTYIVEGLMSYIQNNAEIPENLMEQMKKQSEDVIRAQAAKNWVDYVTIDSLTYMGNYFLSKKTGSYGDENRCCLVYKVTAEESMETTNNETVVETTDVYYYVQYSNLLIEENGNGAVDISNYNIPYHSFRVETDVKSTGWFSYNYSFTFNGYETIDEIYNEIITKNLETYAHEENIVE